ncbi:hypothetical protein DYU11_01660 [Fibrisoma montanum]|uniref:Uncharacterized protein n=1 Tax=Fibrisoma montanum TaxID=2305895 RepID=A0A418MHZ9_9BACT|nr:CFI-box-CTERM domain-containing protein [Fibrisoma montanum]RIV27050.1 hypothetical protein DYU11_01660 [Fibrisoma montanum]
MNTNQGGEHKENLPSHQNKRDIINQPNSLKPGSLIDQSLSNLSQEQIQNLMAKAAEEALRLEVKAREQNFDYKSGRQALEDHIEAFSNLDKKDFTTRHKLSSEIKTGAGRMRIESKTGGMCFVATATYGDASHPDVVFLRYFRDKVLVNSWGGRQFIFFYWHIGPALAKVVMAIRPLKKIARLFLESVVYFVKKFCVIP